MHASLVSSRGDGESPEIQKLTAWDTCPTLGNRVSLSHLSIRKADRKHVAAAVQKTTFLHDRQHAYASDTFTRTSTSLSSSAFELSRKIGATIPSVCYF